jgi:TonB-linked SusC/RagA family outer membrane protein
MRKILLCLWTIVSLPLFLLAQTRSITGTVTDENGNPLPLVTVAQKGTNNGTVTAENGTFTLSVSGENPVLTFSYAGMQAQEIAVGASNTYSVQLNAADAMSEVVVTAFGVRREKKALGYSAQEVKGQELVNTRQTNIVNALRGKAAGVQINSGGGAPGQGSRIVIRGIKSLAPGKNNQPLFVIDGIIMDNSTTTVSTAGGLRGLSNRAADINPDDVETISILKGGAATALYGQAGSNGVVVITTKSARAGKMRVSFTSTYGVDEVNKFPEVQDVYTQGTMGVYNPNEFFPSWGPTVQEAKAIDPTHPDQLYHHYARGYQNGNQFRNSINISGGTENALLTSSFSYFNQEGVIPNSDYKNLSARLSGQFKFSEKLRFNPSLYFINSGGYRVNADRYNEQLTYWTPRYDVKDYIKPDGTMKSYGDTDNPIYGTYSNRYKDDVNRLIGNLALTYSPLKWLDVDYKLGMDYYADFRRHTGPGPKGLVGEIPFSDNELGFVDEDRISNRILTSNIMATLKKDWWDNFNSVLRVGNDVRAIKYSRLTANGAELDVPELLTLNNAKVRTNTEYQEEYRIVSAYGDLALSWKNYLFLNLTGRNDWSSSLSPGNNSFFYPSASLSYVFSDHFALPSFLSFGKLRASWAEIGKDTDPYETNTYYNSSVLTSSSQVIWTRGDAKGDASLKPERTTTLELGTELRFLDNRLGLDFTWYKLNSRDQIIPVAISPTSGFGSVIINAGEIENKGFEVVLNATPVKTKDFTWDAALNFSANKNKVVSIREGLTEIVLESHFGYSGSTATMKYVPGFAVGNIYGSSYQRYYGGGKTDDKVTLYRDLPKVIAASGTNAGFPVRDATQRILGNSQPDWIGGITNTLSYKNFTLSFLWETQQGQDRYNQLGNFMAAFGIAEYTENRNTTTTFEGVLADGTPNNQVVFLGQGVGPDARNYTAGFYRNVYRTITENFVEDASWVRLRNLSLSYTLPEDMFNNKIIQGATVTFTGNNLVLFTDYSGFDPETSSFSAGSNVDAFSGFTYPAIRSYLFSLNLNF